MIIERFEEQVQKFPGNIAIQTKERTLSYRELAREIEIVAAWIIENDRHLPPDREKRQVALLFGHGAGMIIALLGALKAGKVYVPLDTAYPEERLIFMLESSAAYLVLTDRANLPLAGALPEKTGGNIQVMAIDAIDRSGLPGQTDRQPDGDRAAYILYTSGSTGTPKGVVQNQRNVVRYAECLASRCTILPGDRLTLLSVFSHDAAVVDIFGALLNGASLLPYDVKAQAIDRPLSQWLIDEKITVWHSVPTLFRQFVAGLSEGQRFPGIRLVLLGGEEVRETDLIMLRKFFPPAALGNIYGQTESSISSIWLVNRQETWRRVILGEPVPGTKILLARDNGEIVEDVGVGEILVASDYLALGYWQDDEGTGRAFLPDAELGRVYRTGDLGRLMADGSIEFVGRKDFQVKIRGFRVEPAEIESMLLRYPGIREAAVVARENENREKSLWAYLVADEGLDMPAVGEFLSAHLPDYMVPHRLIQLESLPLTPSRKTDRKALAEMDPGDIAPIERPRDELEAKLSRVWADILQVEEGGIGIDSNFFALGGHSLNANIMILRIHKELDVGIPLAEVFKNSTIRGMAQYIRGAGKEAFAAIEPAEKKEYYVLSSAQKRMLVMSQLKPGSLEYNMPIVLSLREDVDLQRLSAGFKQLVARHELLRTSFPLIDGQLVQRVSPTVDFSIQVFTEGNDAHPGKAEDMIRSFIRPFDLGRPPLLRVALIDSLDRGKSLLIDLHHIITDGASQQIIAQEFLDLYAGKALPAPAIHYKDYAEWENSGHGKAFIGRQEAFWLREFSDGAPVLNLPIDRTGNRHQLAEGTTVRFDLEPGVTGALKRLALEENGTPHIILSAIFNVLLARISLQEDIVIGVPVMGRRHADIARVPGMFVNMVALRNRPAPGKTFREFLKEVGEKQKAAFDNQDYPFENLVERLRIDKNPRPYPLFCVSFVFVAGQETGGQAEDLGRVDTETLRLFLHDHIPPQYLLDLIAIDHGDRFAFIFHYRPDLFSPRTVSAFADYFRKISAAVAADPHSRIGDIEIVSKEDKEHWRTRVLEGQAAVQAEFDI